MFGVLTEIRKLRRQMSLSQWLRTTRNAELVVVLGEDFAALIGLMLALIFLGLSGLTGDPLYDALGSISIGVVLIIVSLFVAIRIKSLMVGKSAEPAILAEIQRIIAGDPAINRLLNTITIQVGPKVMLAAKIHMRSDLTIDQAVERINALEERLKKEVPEIGWCFVEPDCRD